MNDGDLTLTVGNATLSGWTEISVQRGLERSVGEFNLAFTEHYPGVSDLIVKPGEPCTVSLGKDVVLTGFVNRFMPSYSSKKHEVRAAGRGKCQDLVDCSAIWPGGQISGANAFVVAQNLAQQYRIKVTCLADIAGLPSISQFNLLIGESSWNAIERVCRYSALLVYEDTDGNLVLDTAGNEAMASGCVEGKNVEEASAIYSDDERYSNYIAYTQSVQLFDEFAPEPPAATVLDPGVGRLRQLDILVETAQADYNIAQKRATWEQARRAGRAFQVAVTVDSWRDSAGTLWTPNRTIPLSLPTLKLPTFDWVIGAVTYKRDDTGTHADLLMMPRNAFLPEPFVLFPVWPDLTPG